ncbi:sigma 54-interacting transcriptional regulator [Candidatus Mcinerneyibacteriota bacterium]|nr:sigma 54-interacting transcriptional regulator [Candidatus Mcinerneyibacteriota bacterium]
MDKNKKRSQPAMSPFAEAILESISDGVFTVDKEWNVTSFNRAAEEITGILREEAIGRRCSDVFRSSMCETDCALKRTIETGRPVVNRSCYIIDGEGERIPISVSTAVLKDDEGHIIGGAETFRDLTEVEQLRQELDERHRIGELISRSPSMKPLFEMLPAVAESGGTVLITGESGTGKEVLARTMHQISPRKEEPFVTVNCGALPDNLLESELFGYKAGAFTGAVKDKPGRFHLARGGTIFLDEIGELSPAMQVKLLRVLQDKTFEPLGGTQTENSNARVIAATNRDLEEEVKAGRFREDLFYRINVIRLHLPPLRERQEDIPLLTEQFIRLFNSRRKNPIQGVSPEVYQAFLSYGWPGNIRELENVIERAFILCRSSVVTSDLLPPELAPPGPPRDISSLQKVSERAEASLLRDVLERNGGDKVKAARELGIHKSTLYRKLKRLGLGN